MNGYREDAGRPAGTAADLPTAGDHEAERWFARMQNPDCGWEERLACRRWQAASPSHAAAYARVEALYRASREFGLHPQYRGAARAARARAEREGRRRRGRRMAGSLGLAAMLVLALGIGWYRWDPAQPERRYATAVGERRSLTLGDGSVVELDTDSAVTVRYNRRQRSLVLTQGRAQFDVAHAPERPFTVQAGEGSVRAVGTRFQVRRQREAVQVTLLEGVVAVSAPDPAAADAVRTATLIAGQALQFGPHGVWVRDRADLDAAQGWTRGELRFRQRPLHELLEEANRYAPVKVRIADPSLKGMPVSGVFSSSDQASLLQALEHVLPVRAERVSANEIVLDRR